MPAAPYEQDPAKWTDLDWHNRNRGNPGSHCDSRWKRRHADALTQGDVVVVESMARVLGRYIRRPEHKSLAPGGGPAGPNTVGLLGRRPVDGHPDSTTLIGKEGNRLVERVIGQVDGRGEYRNEYGMRADPWERTLQRLREIGDARIVEETGFSQSAVYALLAGARPRRERMCVYEAVANQSAV